jgi:hypothetical protein
MLAFGWSPLVLLNTAGDGHNDAVMLAWLAAGLLLMVTERPVPGLTVLLLAGAIKAPALLVTPIAVVWHLRSARPRRLRETAFGLALGALAIALLYLPFWAGQETLSATLGEAGYATASIATVADRILTTRLTPDQARVVTTLLFRGGFAAVYLVLLSQCRAATRQRLLSLGFWAVFAYLALGAFWFMPWYASWALLLATMAACRTTIVPALVLTSTAMLNHAVFGFGAAIVRASPSSTRIEALAALTIWAAPVLTVAWLLIRWRRRPHPIADRPLLASDLRGAGDHSPRQASTSAFDEGPGGRAGHRQEGSCQERLR